MGTRAYSIPTDLCNHRPGQTWCKKGGCRVPSVTTVLGVLNKGPGLMKWAWSQGKEGKDFEETRADAADIGTITHDLSTHWVDTGEEKEMPPGEDIDLARDLFRRFRAFVKREKWRPVTITDMDGAPRTSEIALVSQAYRYGGTLDFLFLDSQGRLVLVDLKTSAGAYAEHFYQLGGYALLVEEETGRAPDDHVIICTPRDEPNTVRVYYSEDPDTEKKIFLASLGLYGLQAQRVKQTGGEAGKASELLELPDGEGGDSGDVEEAGDDTL